MKIFNATGWDREVLSGGKKYFFKAFSETDVVNESHVEHINNAYAYMGLIALNYDEGAMITYPTFEEYKASREMKALNAALKHAEEVLAYETNAQKAAKATPGAEHELRTFRTEKFEKNVKLITSWLKDAGYEKIVEAEEKTEVVEKRPNWKKEVKSGNITTA